MMSFVEQVKEFMVACGQSVDEYNPDQVELYDKLIHEEFFELQECRFETPNDLKELCDLIWVAVGYGLSSNYDLEVAFNEVYRSNMSKLVDGQCVKDESGKVQKGPNYSPANMEPYV